MLERRWIRLSLWPGSVKIKGLLRFARNDTMGTGNDTIEARNNTMGTRNDTMGLAMKRASRVQNAFGNGKH
jgi:hypothetical protein